MSYSGNPVTMNNSRSLFQKRIRHLTAQHPQWWVWFLSIVVWILLISIPFSTNDELNSSPLIYCMTTEVQQGEYASYQTKSIFREATVFSKAVATISKGMPSWIIMVIAMMFPLLNEPVRHVAFSVRSKDRDWCILGFLTGYIIIWSVAGMLFLLLPLFTDLITGIRSSLVNGLINMSGFLLAAILIWLPVRPVLMMKCGYTAPIRIRGWNRYADSISYGMKMGGHCLNTCWAPMAALMLSHHNIYLMFIVTFVIIYERYRLPHISKFTGYVWGVVAITLFGIEIGKGYF